VVGAGGRVGARGRPVPIDDVGAALREAVSALFDPAVAEVAAAPQRANL